MSGHYHQQALLSVHFPRLNKGKKLEKTHLTTKTHLPLWQITSWELGTTLSGRQYLYSHDATKGCVCVSVHVRGDAGLRQQLKVMRPFCPRGAPAMHTKRILTREGLCLWRTNGVTETSDPHASRQHLRQRHSAGRTGPLAALRLILNKPGDGT